ncbi:MAG: serine/threonine-protein kinase, partial [Polyangia bacterium]
MEAAIPPGDDGNKRGEDDGTLDEAVGRRSRRRLLRRTLEVGSRLGRYQIVAPLGEGGMGVVYRAHDAELDRDVAVKLVTTGDAPTDTLATRLLREAQALAQLSHPNVVAVYDVGRVDDGVFLAMELVAGDNGDQWLKKRPPWREVLQVFRDAGRGLAAAHKVGLIHRDFKPANMILGSDGRVRVLDFGLARAAYTGGGDPVELEGLADDSNTWDGSSSENETRDARRASSATGAKEVTRDEPIAPAASSSPPSSKDPMTSSERRLLETPLTQVGAIIGTPPYMAPEQHLGGGCDARTD